MHSASPQSVFLFGPDHTKLGALATRSLGPGVAVALSRGKYLKGYPSHEPNEDGVLAAASGESLCLVVVDGHNGFAAARNALRVVVRHLPVLLTSPHRDAADEIPSLVREAQSRIRRHTRSADPEPSGCALIIALRTGTELSLCSLGDASALRVRNGRVRRLAKPSAYLNADRSLDDLSIIRHRVAPGDVLVLATDGLMDFLGPDQTALRDAADASDAETIAAHLVERAFAGGAGDNIAVAVERAGVEWP